MLLIKGMAISSARTVCILPSVNHTVIKIHRTVFNAYIVDGEKNPSFFFLFGACFCRSRMSLKL